MILLVPVLLGLGCIVALVLAYGDDRLFVIGGLLTAMWAGAMLLWWCNALWLLPLFDLTVGAMAIRFWIGDGASWSLSIAFITTYRLAAHAIDWFTHSAFFVSYAHAINALFALQLIIIASTGGADVGRRWICWFRGFCRVGGLGPARSPGLSRVR